MLFITVIFAFYHLASADALGGALINAGATLLEHERGHNTFLFNGLLLDGDSCFESGDGHYPDGDCFSYGADVMLIKETTVKCGALYFHRRHCKTQLCCRKLQLCRPALPLPQTQQNKRAFVTSKRKAHSKASGLKKTWHSWADGAYLAGRCGPEAPHLPDGKEAGCNPQDLLANCCSRAGWCVPC